MLLLLMHVHTTTILDSISTVLMLEFETLQQFRGTLASLGLQALVKSTLTLAVVQDLLRIIVLQRLLVIPGTFWHRVLLLLGLVSQ